MLALNGLLAVAAADPSGKPVDQKTLAEKLKFYRSIETLKTDFVETKHLSEMDLNLKSEGKMELKAPTNVLWQITKPSALKIKIDPTGIEIQSESGTQKFKLQDLSKDNAARGLGLLLPWLSFDAKALSEQYTIFEKSTNTFEFTPKSEKSSILKMSAELNTRGALQRLKLFESSGDTLTIDFKNPVVTRKK